MAPGARDALTDLTGLFLRHTGHDVEDDFLLLAALGDAVDRDESGRLLPMAHAFRDPSPESVQPHDDEYDALPIRAQPADVRRQRLIARPIVAFATHHVLVFVGDELPMRRGVTSTVGQLGGETLAVPVLFFRGHTGVDDRSSDPSGGLGVFRGTPPMFLLRSVLVA